MVRYMYLGYAILGVIVGGFAARWGGNFLVGAIGGGVLGVALARLVELDRRVRQLQSSVREPGGDGVSTREQPPVPEAPEASSAWSEPEPPGPEPFESPDEEPSPQVPADVPESPAPTEPAKSSPNWPGLEQAALRPSILQPFLT